jgi:hypothetical protein
LAQDLTAAGVRTPSPRSILAGVETMSAASGIFHHHCWYLTRAVVDSSQAVNKALVKDG